MASEIIKLKDSYIDAAFVADNATKEIVATDKSDRPVRLTVGQVFKTTRTSTGAEAMPHKTAKEIQTEFNVSKKVADKIIYEAKVWLHSPKVTHDLVNRLTTNGYGVVKPKMSASGKPILEFDVAPQMSKSLAKSANKEITKEQAMAVVAGFGAMSVEELERLIVLAKAQTASEAEADDAEQAAETVES